MSSQMLTFFMFMTLVLYCGASSIFKIDPDEISTIEELVGARGFVVQPHQVLTRDGYILKIDRIVTPNFNPRTYNLYRKPVLAAHGIFLDTAMFLINSPQLHSNVSKCGDTLAFCMLMSGRYDMWLLNSRGNGRSMEHVKYSPKDDQFWRFSMDQMAEYDLPATIELVRRRTGHRKIGYLGFSQGAAQMFALLSQRPEYSEVIHPFVAWAPAVFVGSSNSLISIFSRILHPLFIQAGGLFPLGDPLQRALIQWVICRSKIGQQMCHLAIDKVTSFGNTNATRIPTYSHFMMTYSSNWVAAHLGQNSQHNVFRRLSYPTVGENIQKYGSPTPPHYPLWNIAKSMKIHIFYGATDPVVNAVDVEKLIRLLRKYGLHYVTGHKVPLPRWGHADYFLSPLAGRLVYDETLAYFDRYYY